MSVPEDHFPTIDEFREIVSDLLDELPEVFFKQLSGGIVVEDVTVRSPYAKADDLYNLGSYNWNSLGRQIKIYYGTFAKLYSHLRGEALKQKIREVVRHEFRHHLEFLAGVHGRDSLEAEDRRQIREYLRTHS